MPPAETKDLRLALARLSHLDDLLDHEAVVFRYEGEYLGAGNTHFVEGFIYPQLLLRPQYDVGSLLRLPKRDIMDTNPFRQRELASHLVEIVVLGDPVLVHQIGWMFVRHVCYP